ncbi:Zinc transporter 1 [Platysternon megacephalum]|uniref:Zinc transporter 1 n=1 Tax=Platysternon megacephalum TaxID=55544 RepID=A0A4D9DWN3_9SAUR|nr:Zinc transporter 1 [Platysternon megacephalum]
MEEGIRLLVAGQQQQGTLLMQLMENLQWQQEVQFVVQQWYGGFYPQIRYQVGETYGKTTSRLLTDPSVPKSPCSVLAPLGKPRFLEDFSGTKHPSNQMLDQNYSYFPGYTGFIPYQHAQFAPYYPPPATESRAPLLMLLRAQGQQSWPVRIEGVPLDAVTETVDLSRYNQLPKLDVPNLIQRKAISGYTGFVPRFSWIMGVNYLKGVKDAMNEFDRNQDLSDIFEKTRADQKKEFSSHRQF